MNTIKIFASAFTATALTFTLSAQSAFEAATLSQLQMRGSARFMSMGGAFTALGADISTLNQNPGGIGLYRSSDIGATLDIDFQSAKSRFDGGSYTMSQTRVACNNFGYVGAVNLGDDLAMPYFNWGVSYSRVASFDRHYGSSLGNIGTSYSNFIADYTQFNGWTPAELVSTQSNYNPYQESWAPWPSIMMYNSYGINPTTDASTDYKGLWNYDSTSGSGWYEVREKGYVDEYNIDFGGNILNTVYWGLGIGVTDLDYTSTTWYGEDLNNARITRLNRSGYPEGYDSGDANWQINNIKRINGSGYNFKFGLIAKPVQEFRIGIAVHTPTYYKLTYEAWAQQDYYYDAASYTKPLSKSEQSDYGWSDTYDFKMRTPWRLMVGAAGVIGNRAIISADYEYRPTQSMKVKDADGNQYYDVTDEIKHTYKDQNIVRLGAEFRLTPSFSLRAGYVYESSPITQTVTDEGITGYVGKQGFNQVAVNPISGPAETGTQPSVTLDKTTQYITCGIGYRYKFFYADAAFVHRNRASTFQSFANYQELIPDATGDTYFVTAPTAKVSQNDNSLVLTVGVRF